jgi:hypothetical protein
MAGSGRFLPYVNEFRLVKRRTPRDETQSLQGETCSSPKWEEDQKSNLSPAERIMEDRLAFRTDFRRRSTTESGGVDHLEW